MNVGMLWFDNDPRTALSAKVNRAADYYRQKYGRIANLCMVNPAMLGEKKPAGEMEAGKIAVRPNRAILPGHLWIGNDDDTNQ